MTYEEIVKQIEEAIETGGRIAKIQNLPETFLTKGYHDILDFINRQQGMIDGLIAGQETLQKALAEKNAEIERLRKELVLKGLEYTLLEKDRAKDICDFAEKLKTIKSEAIKEFAEKLKSYLLLSKSHDMSVVSLDNIDNLVKEMVGDAE